MKPLFTNGNSRTLTPTALNMALPTAGASGGRAGSPRPVGGKSESRKVISIRGALGMRNQDDQLVALMPLYIKSHSYGEYVFDWGWADGYLPFKQ